MKYQNANDILPDELLSRIQEYIQGGLLYIPKSKERRSLWGECSGARLRIAAFFAFHASLSGKPCAVSEQRLAAAKQTLFEWTGEDHELCVIIDGNVDAGFLHVGYRGGNVAWIEDIYVDAEKRGRGIASRAIAEAEKTSGRARDIRRFVLMWCRETPPRLRCTGDSDTIF